MDRYPDPSGEKSLVWFPRTDAGAAEMLAQTHGEKLRYCYGKGWLYYDGKCWSLKRGEEMARRSCVQSSRQLRKEALEDDNREAIEKYARKLENTTDSLKNMVWVCDGAKWIWNWVDSSYPESIQILDYFHCSEKLHEFAREAIKNPKRRKDWIKEQQELLMTDEAKTVIANLRVINKSGN